MKLINIAETPLTAGFATITYYGDCNSTGPRYSLYVNTYDSYLFIPNSFKKGVVNAEGLNFTGIPLTNASVQVYVDKYPNSTAGKLVGSASYLNTTNVAVTAVYDSAKGGIQYVFFDVLYKGMHLFFLLCFVTDSPF